MTPGDVQALGSYLEAYREAVYAAQMPEPVTADTVTVYASALERYSIERVENALRLHVQDPDHGRWFPKPADIVRGCRRLSQGNAPERQTPAALPHPERVLNRRSFRALVAEATERYRRIRDETDGDGRAKARAVNAAWRRGMRLADE